MKKNFIKYIILVLLIILVVGIIFDIVIFIMYQNNKKMKFSKVNDALLQIENKYVNKFVDISDDNNTVVDLNKYNMENKPQENYKEKIVDFLNNEQQITNEDKEKINNIIHEIHNNLNNEEKTITEGITETTYSNKELNELLDEIINDIPYNLKIEYVDHSPTIYKKEYYFFDNILIKVYKPHGEVLPTYITSREYKTFYYYDKKLDFNDIFSYIYVPYVSQEPTWNFTTNNEEMNEYMKDKRFSFSIEGVVEKIAKETETVKIYTKKYESFYD